jgi:hypothetical protein
MNEPSKHERIEHPDDPERCQSMAGSQQCQYKKVQNSDYCIMHGGNVAYQKAQAASLKMYNLAQWEAAVGKFAESSHIKSLRSEIGILRVILERKLLSCKDDQDLLLRSSSLSDLVIKVGKLVEQCDRIDTRLGQTLDREQLLALGQKIVELVSQFLTDPEMLKAFAGKLVEVMTDDYRTRTERLIQN